MKIDIHITDATPEEASLVLAGVTVSQAVGRVAARIVQKKAEERTADPTCVEETGCEGCQNTEFDAHTCEECSPPPAPIAKKLKEKFNPPGDERTPKPAKKTLKQKTRVSKYGIPSSLYTENKKEYQRLFSVCKAHDLTYEQALVYKRQKPGKKKNVAKPAEAKPSAKAIAPSNEGKKPAKVKKARLPLRMKNQQPAPEASEEKPVTTHYPVETPHTAAAEDPLDPQEPEYHIGGLDQDLTDALPDEAPPTGHKEKVENAKTMESIKIGDQVRQIAGMKICAGIGVVKRAPPGNPDVLVGFGNGQEWINRKNLAPVMA